jgi:hypothetical protein
MKPRPLQSATILSIDFSVFESIFPPGSTNFGIPAKSAALIQRINKL